MSCTGKIVAACASCGVQLNDRKAAPRGPAMVRYCSNACRQRAYRQRVKGGPALDTCTNFTQLNRLIGRDHDLAEIRRTLRGARLLTIAGPPGAGKSRLAAEIAEREQRVSHRGAVVLDFCSPHLAQLGASAMDAALGQTVCGLDPTAPDSAARSDEQLLVLENCDRVLEICGSSVVRLLTRFPQLRILTTSREPWRLSGEVVYRLTGLSLPDPVNGDTLDGCLRSGAVRFFLDRASAVKQDFALTDDNAADVRTICTALDGLPLALELAAQLLGALPVAEVRHRVVDQPSVLGQGWRTAEFRHRTWDAALQWSYDGLDADEQRLFRRLCLMDGSVTIESAETAYHDRSGPAAAVPGLLVRLEAKSLVVAGSGIADRTATFVVPGHSREFGRRQAARAGERDLVLGRLADSLTERARQFHRGPFPGRDALSALSAERDTICALLRWMGDGRDERQLSLCWALAAIEMMDARSTDDALTMVLHSLEVTDPASPRRGEALESALMLACWRGRGEQALHLARETRRLDLASTDDLPYARTLLLSSLSQEMYGVSGSGWPGLLSALQIVKRHDDTGTAAACRAHLARHLMRLGRPAAAQRLIDKSLPVLRASSPPAELAIALLTAGALALERDDPSRAAEYFREVLTSADRCGAYDAAAGLALCAARTDNLEHALKLMTAIEGRHCAVLLLFPTWSEQLAKAYDLGISIVPKARVLAALQSGRALGMRQSDAPTVHNTAPALPAGDVDVLTAREWDVLRLVMEGLTNLQIAHRLYVSVRTVETHVRKIRLVLGLRSRAHMAAWAARHAPTAA